MKILTVFLYVVDYDIRIHILYIYHYVKYIVLIIQLMTNELYILIYLPFS